ncbi:carboxymuconolactone decarboxylase family protein [Actinomycetospora aeridis]|uniref:Carboxymuconolactone decarboxylase family protein n=1 Tax=Actinomycetospora aeridis TaxID=3129231 RepID=A0ABU8N1J2_9PSEU
MTAPPAPSALLALARRPLRRAVHDARHVSPVPYRRADAPVRRVYDAVERDFGMLAPPIAVHSPAPVVMTAVWRLLRSTLLAPGTASRAAKEAVAAAVSRANRCPYCVEVHDAGLDALDGAGAHDDLAAWIDGSGPAPDAGRADLDDLLDVAATFEYLNRVVTVLLPASPLPPAAPSAVRRRALALLGSAARGAVAGRATERAPRLLADVADAAAAALPHGSAAGEDLVREVAAGARRGLTSGARPTDVTVVPGLDADAPAPVRLAVLAANAPWRVTDPVVREARADLPDRAGDAAVVALVALGAATAARLRSDARAAGAREAS